MAAQIDAWHQADDRRVIFLTCYWMTTRNVLHTIHEGGFIDGPWVERLLTRFAAYYWDALDAREAGLQAPRVWNLAHDVAEDPAGIAVESLLLGVNAHINHDLVLAVADLLRPEWDTLDAVRKGHRHSDFDTINTVIADTIATVEATVIAEYAHLARWFTQWAAPAEHTVMLHLIHSWRDDVWQRATETFVPMTEGDEALRHSLDADAVARMHGLLATTTFAEHRFLRAFTWAHRHHVL